DLEPVADDARIPEQAAHLAGTEARDLLGIEAGERRAVGLALVEDRAPREAGLGALEDQELELLAIVVDRRSPFAIVVRDHQGIIRRPLAASLLRHLAPRRLRAAPGSVPGLLRALAP